MHSAGHKNFDAIFLQIVEFSVARRGGAKMYEKKTFFTTKIHN